jgi:hypothetical protein
MWKSWVTKINIVVFWVGKIERDSYEDLGVNGNPIPK